MANLPNKTVTVADNLHYAKLGEKTVLINEEVTNFTQAVAPVTVEKHFIGEKNKRVDVKGFAPTVAYSAALNPTDPFLMYLYEIGKDEKVGETFDEYEVETWNVVSEGVFVARKHTYEVQPANPGSGAGGEDLKMEGTLAQKGNTIKGKFDIATKAFTAAEA